MLEQYNSLGLLKPTCLKLSALKSSILLISSFEHICGGEYENLDAWADYPGTIINLPEFDVNKLRHAQEVFKRPILGGLDHRGVLINGTLEEVYAQVDSVLTKGPKNIIIGANCTVPDSTASDRLHAIVEYVHNWRQTHK